MGRGGEGEMGGESSLGDRVRLPGLRWNRQICRLLPVPLSSLETGTRYIVPVAAALWLGARKSAREESTERDKRQEYRAGQHHLLQKLLHFGRGQVLDVEGSLHPVCVHFKVRHLHAGVELLLSRAHERHVLWVSGRCLQENLKE